MKERQHRELQKWNVIIDSQSYIGPIGIDFSGLNIRPVSRTLRIDSKFLKIKNQFLLRQAKVQLLDQMILILRMLQLKKLRRLINNYSGRLGIGRAISFVASHTLLIITIFQKLIQF